MQWKRDEVNDDGDENDEDKDDDGHLVFPINTSTLKWIVLYSVLLVKIHSVVLSWPMSAASVQRPTAEPGISTSSRPAL